MLLTIWLKTGRLSIVTGNSPSQVGYVYERLVCFQVSVRVHGLSGGRVLVLNHDDAQSFLRQNNNSIGQDGKLTEKPQKSMTGWLPGGWSKGLDTESWTVGEISNMFDILPIHCDKPGKCNRP